MVKICARKNNNSNDSNLKIIEISSIDKLIKNTNIKAIFTNGTLADKLYRQNFNKN